MKYGKKLTSMIGIGIALILCLTGAMGTALMKSNFGKTDVQDIKIISESGYRLSMDAYVPKNATKETPAPAIVIMHGGNGNKEMMTKYAMELSRRGYVAVSVDMYSHGDSQDLPDSTWLTSGRGLYDAVKAVAKWPFVNTEQISLLGYSRGGKAAGEALQEDNVGLNVIKSIYLVYSDPIYKNADGFADQYGARNIAVIVDLYDEFFFTEKPNDTGVYSNDANKFAKTLTSPVEYMNTSIAQSFLHFGEDPAGLEVRQDGVIYEKDYNGITATREIQLLGQDHASGQYSPTCMKSMLKFFERVMPGPVQLSSSNLMIHAYDIFSFFGVFGLLMLLVSLIVWITEKAAWFGELKLEEPGMAQIKDNKSRIWGWCCVIVGCVFTILVIYILNKMRISAYHDTVFRSSGPVYTSLICLLGASFTLIVSAVTYRFIGEKQGMRENLSKVFIGSRKILKSALAALIAIVVLYVFIFGIKYFLGTSFRFVFWGIETFSADRIAGMLTVLPMLTMFYVIASINNDVFNYTSNFGKNPMVNSLLTAFVNALPMLSVMGFCYGRFRLTGWNPMFGGNAAAASSVYGLPMIVFAMVFVSRRIYLKTGNPYLGGFACGFLTTIMTWSVCETRLPEVDEPFMLSWKIIAMFLLACAILGICLKYFRSSYPGILQMASAGQEEVEEEKAV